MSKFGEREPALVAVACSERRAEMLGSDFLKAREVLPGSFGVALALIGARDTKFRGSMIRKRGKRLLKFGDGFVVALQLRVRYPRK